MRFQTHQSSRRLSKSSVERIKYPVCKILLSQFIPYMLYGVEFWSIGWQSHQRHVFRNDQLT